jgi:hypothetical protein
MDAGKGKPGRFRASQALDYRVFQKGVSRSSRKWMKLIHRKCVVEVVSPVYLVERAGSQPQQSLGGNGIANLGVQA